MDEAFLLRPERIDAKPMVFEGVFTPGELERLGDSLADGRGALRYRIQAQHDRQRRRVVTCIIEGFVFLTCQSSLEAFRHAISVEDRLVLVDSEAELPAIGEESDSEDYLVVDGPLDIRDVVEDAILLALPMVPRKPGPEDGGGAKAAVREDSPFAALASLKKGKQT